MINTFTVFFCTVKVIISNSLEGKGMHSSSSNPLCLSFKKRRNFWPVLKRWKNNPHDSYYVNVIAICVCISQDLVE